jgi:hypothetical protein
MFQRAVRERHVGRPDPLADGLRQDVLADDVVFVADEQVVRDRRQRWHLLAPFVEVDRGAVRLPGRLQDRQALVDHEQLVRDRLSHGGGLAHHRLLRPIEDLGPLLLHRAQCHDPDQRRQREGDNGDRATGREFGFADARRPDVLDRNELGRPGPCRTRPCPLAPALETVTHSSLLLGSLLLASQLDHDFAGG